MSDTFEVAGRTVTRIVNDDADTWTWEWPRGEMVLQVEYAHAAGRWSYATGHATDGGWTVNELDWSRVRDYDAAERRVIAWIEGRRFA